MKQTLGFFLYCITMVLIFVGCEADQIVCEEDGNINLSTFLDCHSDKIRSDNLIACAAGGQEGFLDDPSFPVSVFFLPVEGARDFLYFETPASSNSIDPDDLSLYEGGRNIYVDEGVFNGYLRRFLRASSSGSEVWSRVVYFTEDSIHISNAIRIKNKSKPSEYANSLLNIDLSTPTAPLFTWEDGRTPENAIYFQVVSDSNGDLISGTYTFEKRFRFYDLSNVVLNIRDVQPAPSLEAGQPYNFTLMGVSLDNWVNLIADTSFVAE